MDPVVQRHHDEVLDALTAVASDTGIPAELGELVQADRRSSYRYLGIRTPDRRRRVAKGFSFTTGPNEAVLAAWNDIWHVTDHGDVLFAVLDFYRRGDVPSTDPQFWQTASSWIERIDNWAHADDLARLYSVALAAFADLVSPTLERWSLADDEWHRRVSMVSLIHYSGKNAAFLPIETTLEIVANCVSDERETVSKAVGWVLRENMATSPDEVIDFLHEHATTMAAPAIRRATERLPPDQRQRVRDSLR